MVKALKEAVNIPVGFHAHNNMGLALGNSLAAYEAGASSIDGCLAGLGAGAGNAQTEVLAAVFNLMGVETGLDLYALMDAAEDRVRPHMLRPPLVDRNTLSLGYAGVYSSFLLHAERAAERYGVDTRDILVELGRRKTVGGQEDLIIDVANELAENAGKP
jgi:4-hydroxy 2-oxovalerate aldolase